MLETWSSFFWRMVKTPIGVSWPFLPVETVETPISLPRRWTWRSCSLIETMIDTGPRGCSSGCQVNWPGFSFRTSAAMSARRRADEEGAGGEAGHSGEGGAAGREERSVGHGVLSGVDCERHGSPSRRALLDAGVSAGNQGTRGALPTWPECHISGRVAP